MSRLRETLAALRRTLRNPAIARLQIAVAGSSLGHWMVSVVLGVVVFQAGGAFATGLMIVCKMVPSGVAALLFGAVADRVPRRSVMAFSDASGTVLVLLTAVLVEAGVAYGWIIVAATVRGVAEAGFHPARAAILPSLARAPEELTAANVVASTIDSVALAAGPALGAVLLAATSPQAALVVAAAFIAFSAAAVLGIPADRPDRATEDEAAGSLTAELREGLRVTLTDPRVRLVTGLMAAQLAVDGALGVLLVAVALDLLDLGQAGLGLLDTMIGIGAFAGAAGALGLVTRSRLAPSFALGMVLWGLPLVAIGLFPTTGVAVAALVVLGFGNTILDVSGFTMLQRGAPDDVLGRVFGVFEALALAAVAAGAAITAPLIGALGLETALVVVGAFLPVLAVLSLGALRRGEALARVPSEEALALLRGSPIFAPLAGLTLEALAGRLDAQPAAAGAEVVVQGDRGDRYYLIAEGEVDVEVDGRVVRTQGAGSGFGEIALLRDGPRTATVRARSDARLLSLEREDFLAAVTGHAESEREAGAIAGARLEWARPRPING